MNNQELKKAVKAIKKVSLKDYQKIIHVCTNHTGKMQGICSISTPCDLNRYCKFRATIPGNICQSCFAFRMMKTYKNLSNANAKNYEIFTTKIVPVVPILDMFRIFRLESFGDTANITQAINYILLAHFNRKTAVTVWTKNPNFYALALKQLEEIGIKKPINLHIVYSSPRINEEGIIWKKFPFVDHVFTVYTKEFAEENNININCGARSCATCQRCYHNKKNEFFVNELLK